MVMHMDKFPLLNACRMRDAANASDYALNLLCRNLDIQADGEEVAFLRDALKETERHLRTEYHQHRIDRLNGATDGHGGEG